MNTEEFIASLSWDDLPATTRGMARLCVLDALGCSIAGSRHQGLSNIIDKIAARGVSGRSPVWGTAYETDLAWAIFFNAHNAAYYDLDDGHRRAQGHPGAAVIPAALAISQQLGRSCREFLEAVVAGYEIAIRSALVMRALGGPRKGSGGWVVTGVAAAAAKLMKLDEQQIRHAIGLAEYYAPQATQDRSASSPSEMKEGIPWAAYTGYSTAILAASGLGAMSPHLSVSSFVDDLGERYEIDNSYFKTYASCRWAHPAIDGLKDMLLEGSGRVADIEEIRIHTFEKAALMNRLDPVNTMEAVYSIPYAVASFLYHGKLGPNQVSSDMLANPEVSKLSRRVKLIVDDELSAQFPEKCLQRLEVTFSCGGEYRSGLLSAKGDPATPYSYEELLEKFQSLTENIFGRQWLKIAEHINTMDEHPAGSLVKMLTV
jgi:2-methylcitrate dehydratase PrpD